MPEKNRPAVGGVIAIKKTALKLLLEQLQAAGYSLEGPRVQDSAILYEELQGIDDLPHGFITEQAPGRFRLVPAIRAGYFDFIPGAASWKKFLFPPRLGLFSAQRNGKSWEMQAPEAADEAAYAFVGVRPCELAAIQIQDKVFLRDDFADSHYQSRRSKLFILAVNCLHPAGTCFCGTMETGPRTKNGFDLCLTELKDDFLVEVGSELGKNIVAAVPSDPASAYLLGEAEAALQHAATTVVCGITKATCAEDILGRLDDPHWESIAKRCLSCGNCTLACPTCFCWDTTDQTSLDQSATRRERTWDSCFNPSYSYQAGGNTRPTIRSRYRQWLSHKFGSWQQQYGTLGCVGCGRCITWCPVGIDTRVEVATLQQGTQE